MGAQLYIGTSGWHYSDWIGRFYPRSITGYHELSYHARYFTTVENNSSFYRIASQSTYETWDRMTPDTYRFSIKLNRAITHIHRLNLDDDVIAKVTSILQSTQVLKSKLGAILLQLPANFKYNLDRLDTFLAFFTAEVRKKPYQFDIAIEFRSQQWLNNEVMTLLKKYNVALVASQSSRWPEMRHVTADIAYIRLHGPGRLFASSYSEKQLKEWTTYIKSLSGQVKRVYVYFNNDFHGYALRNARKLQTLLDQ